LSKTGTYTYYVTIPKSEIDALGWKERQLLKVRRSGSRIVIEDA
jgi:bifunctional DNA-binding transcriptional regulator/antitoxin component of YhaV-PrlF toxin-antitoxin module